MTNEFTFRVLTCEDWKDISHDQLEVSLDEGGIQLRKDVNEGAYITSPPLDSGIENCRWHRIVLDADIPENSTLTVYFYTSDEQEKSEPDWYGPIVLSFSSSKDALLTQHPASSIQHPASSTQHPASGRYISLKIDFQREGQESPVLQQVTLYYPRLSYLRYLPAIYQQDSASRDFLERFLSIFESALFDTEDTISSLPGYIDPMAAPWNFVPWLARWVSLDLYELLGEKNRDFILQATNLYKQKGTMAGLARLVEFLTGCSRCCVKEYMNNVFRSYGMEHLETDEIPWGNGQQRRRFSRKMSTTVDTADPDMLAKMGTYEDEMHYVIDTGKTGRYAPYVIGLFIFVSKDGELRINKNELYKLINSFLPVFVRAEITIIFETVYEVYPIGKVTDEYYDYVHGFTEEIFSNVWGVYADTVSWKWFFTYGGDKEHGITNDKDYRTPHSKIDVELPL